jgi:acetolactate synthase-1/3 small subunit
MTGTGDKLNAFLTSLSSISIYEVVRSGAIGIGRGEKSLTL